jgi:hypothetical protein
MVVGTGWCIDSRANMTCSGTRCGYLRADVDELAKVGGMVSKIVSTC